MQRTNKDLLSDVEAKEEKRVPYRVPAIIYEGIISIRAGSPIRPGPGSFGGDPPAPFEGPASR